MHTDLTWPFYVTNLFIIIIIKHKLIAQVNKYWMWVYN